jgi:hypothetical protein
MAILLDPHSNESDLPDELRLRDETHFTGVNIASIILAAPIRCDWRLDHIPEDSSNALTTLISREEVP